MFVSPKFNVGVVALANGADSTVTTATEKLTQTLCGDKPEPPEVRKHIKLTGDQMKGLVGEYACAAGFVLHVTLDGDELYAQVIGQPSIRVYPESKTRFFYRVVEAELEFELDEKSGQAGKVTVFQNGMELPCQRVK